MQWKKKQTNKQTKPSKHTKKSHNVWLQTHNPFLYHGNTFVPNMLNINKTMLR